MNIGKFRDRITELQNQSVKNTTHGGKTTNWVESGRFWGELKSLSGRQFIEAQQVNNEVTAKLYCRYRASLTESHRIRFSGCDYDIEHIANPDGQKRFMEVLLKVVK